jgi:hypothetical protein
MVLHFSPWPILVFVDGSTVDVYIFLKFNDNFFLLLSPLNIGSYVSVFPLYP